MFSAACVSPLVTRMSCHVAFAPRNSCVSSITGHLRPASLDDRGVELTIAQGHAGGDADEHHHRDRAHSTHGVAWVLASLVAVADLSLRRCSTGRQGELRPVESEEVSSGNL